MVVSDNIVALFFETAKQFPDKVAIVYKKESVSYKKLAIDVQSTAAFLKSKGLRQGDRVLVFIPMSIHLYTVVLALFYLGAVVVFLDEWVGVKRMEECCKIAQCKGFMGSWKIQILSFFSKGLRSIPVKLNLNFIADNPEINMTEASPNDTALITFTTGSTGPPKAAKRTHGFLNKQFIALKEVINPIPDDIDLTTLPIVLLINLGIGSTSVIADFKSKKPMELKPENIFTQISTYSINRITASPYFISRISDLAIEHSFNTDQIKNIFTGGGPVFPNDAKKYLKAFPSANITVVYGSTEAEPISTIPATELINSPSDFLKVGVPNKNIRIKILPIIDEPIKVADKEQFEEMALKQGNIGEIIVAGDHVLKEYFNSDEAFIQNKIIAGNEIWHRTGDAGRINEQGELELAGRCKSIITYEGAYVYPFIFENACMNIDGVKAATILEIDGKIIIAVETNQAAILQKIIKDMLNLLPLASKVVFLRRIPRDPRHFSKIDYERLKHVVNKVL